MNRTIKLATEAKMISVVTTPTMPSVTAHHGATRKDEAPYSGVGPTNILPRAALPTVSQHSTAQRRLSGFPVGNSCKINGRQQKTPQRPGEHVDRHEQPQGELRPVVCRRRRS